MLLGKVVRYPGKTNRTVNLKEGRANNGSSHTVKNLHTEKKPHKGWDLTHHRKSENSTELRIMLFTALEAV